ncbi:hypothetical protein [Methanobrevibacter arboriphilus]|uniref:hypothetical protein n=1 Tax=Methanobrevibacter arboriphilus TaxID=39441 RepID=UPI000AAC6C47|nr:hypothetical protein [Methanobrevibacter arboriphilus]
MNLLILKKISDLRRGPKLSFIWNGKFSEKDIDEIINLLINKRNYFSSVEHPITILFKGTTIEHDYINNFIKVNNNSKKHMHAIFSMIIYTFDEECFMKFLKKFLILNNDIEIFKCISLMKSEAKFISSFSSLEEEGVVSYQKVLSMVEDLPNISNFSKHISYLKDLINQTKKNINLLKKDEFKDDFFLIHKILFGFIR